MRLSRARLVLRCLFAMLCVFGSMAKAGDGSESEGVMDCRHAAARIETQGFIPVGGIEQWITIRGARCDNPVILVVHGGPGNPMSPYAEAVYGAWEKEFTVAQWDQRGAGKTFGRNPGSAESVLTIDQMARDGIEVASYLTRHLQQKKVILLGGSWGSVLGVHMIKARPDLFHAYVGAGQLVASAENQAATVGKVRALARAAGDTKTLSTLEALGTPPWTDPRNFGVLRRATRLYEKKSTVAAPASWWVPSPQYTTPRALADYESGEDFSYLQFVGMQGDGMFSTIDLWQLGSRFDVPVFLIQGSEDLVTVPEVAKRYYDSLSAPDKAFILLPKTGHDPNPMMVDAEYEVLRTRVVPRLRQR